MPLSYKVSHQVNFFFTQSRYVSLTKPSCDHFNVLKQMVEVKNQCGLELSEQVF